MTAMKSGPFGVRVSDHVIARYRERIHAMHGFTDEQLRQSLIELLRAPALAGACRYAIGDLVFCFARNGDVVVVTTVRPRKGPNKRWRKGEDARQSA